MQFKDTSESAQLLAQKIQAEELTNLSLTYINPDARDFATKISQSLSLPLVQLETSISHHQEIKGNLVIIDDGSTRAGEYTEFVDYLRHHHPTANIIIAVPFIPESEKSQFEQMADSFITLYIEPLFFSINQFYQNN